MNPKKNGSFVYIFPFLLLLVFGLSIYFLFFFRQASRSFRELGTRIFQEQLLPNTLNLHYTVAHPEDYGIYSYQPCLPVYSEKRRLAQMAQSENYLYSLQHILKHKNTLSGENANTASLLFSSLALAHKLSSFSYYEEPLSPGSGMQSQLPILLAEYSFRSKRDVEDYLSLLSQSGAYFQGLVRYEQNKAAAGLFMSDASLNKLLEQCHSMIDEESLSRGSHFLQTTFLERLEGLVNTGILSQKEAQQYASRNHDLLSQVLLPAYTSLARELSALRGMGENNRGLAQLPKGQEYYTLLLRQSTGSFRSVSAIKKMLYQQFQTEYQAIQELLSEAPQLSDSRYQLDDPALFPFADATEMLSDLQKRICADFPALPADSKENVECQVKTLSANLEPYCAPAFYLTPPIDESTQNVIYINKRDTPDGLSLYTTLAHEGYPGHLYQSVYDQLYGQKQERNPVRAVLWYGGYQEGWAVYTEFLSYRYAARALQEAGKAELAPTCLLEFHNRSLQLCLYSILDIAIHYDGASPEEITGILEELGIKESSSCQWIYEYITEEPANYPKYYVGYLEILELQKKARSLWGTDYTDLRFHQFFLECGPADFSYLTRLLEQTAPAGKNPGYSSIMLSR